MLVPFTGIYLWMQYQKKLIRKEVKIKLINSIDKEELVMLTFTRYEITTKLKWDHSKEFEYQGKMYDIVEVNTKDDTIFYWCWPDHKETKLNKQLNKLIAQALGNNQQNKEKHKRFQNFYKSLYHPAASDLNIMLFPANNQLLFSYARDLTTLYLPPPVPPPKIKYAVLLKFS